MLKPHRLRVRGTYDILRAALEEVNKNPEELLRAGREADALVAQSGGRYDPAGKLALSVALTDKPTTMLLKGYEFRTELSDISGAVRVVWGDKPLDSNVPFYTDARAARTVSPPLYYVVPPQWTAAAEVLRAHGLKLQRLAAPLTVEVESYRFKEVKWSPNSFEGRTLVSYKVEPVREQRTFPAGSLVVSMSQPAARAALHLLEPEAPDSLAAWGFFAPVFEQKEYGEDYILEKLAREMLAKDAGLRREFETRVAADPKFAASASERLRFFHERSPYFDRMMNLYPVGRITSPLTARLTDF
jgi:hypothetical protein